jgi:hypothetical protein
VAKPAASAPSGSTKLPESQQASASASLASSSHDLLPLLAGEAGNVDKWTATWHNPDSFKCKVSAALEMSTSPFGLDCCHIGAPENIEKWRKEIDIARTLGGDQVFKPMGGMMQPASPAGLHLGTE